MTCKKQLCKTILDKLDEYEDSKSDMMKTLKKVYSIPDFIMLIVGSIGAGKSICVGSIIAYNKKAKKYSEIVVFSGSVENGYYTRNGIPKNLQRREVTVRDLSAIQQQQIARNQNIKDDKKKHRVLIVVDDGLVSVGDRKTQQELTKFLSVIRHYQCSLIFVSQSIKNISPLLRSNAHFFMLYKMIGKSNLDIIHQEISMGENKEKFIRDYIERCKDKNCLFVDNTTDTLSERISCFRVDMKKAGVKE